MTDTLRSLSVGPEVGNWQRFLVAMNVHDYDGFPIVVDEVYGGRTAHGTRVYQAFRKLPETGFVDTLTRKTALAEGFIPFVSARSQSVLWPAKKKRAIDVVVMHTMEAPEKPSTAEAVAAWFAGPNAPKASAHYCVDSDSVVQCVRDSDVAWHAPGANHNGIGVELAGYAKQTAEEWADTFSEMMLQRAAHLVARLCRDNAVPVVKLSPEELKDGKRGLCGHVDVTMGLNAGKGHTDPGEGYPWQEFLQMVASLV